MPPILKRLGLIATVLLFGGCTSVADVVGSSVVVALVDRTVSGYAGKDCRLDRLVRGGALCETGQAPRARDSAPVYCLRTLGVPDCYAEPKPYHWEIPSQARGAAPDTATGPADASADEVERAPVKTEHPKVQPAESKLSSATPPRPLATN